jgi:hypothetical protein
MFIDEVTPYKVARALAPVIRLHSKDPHQPTSVDWFLSRCQLVRGRGKVERDGFDLPKGMTVLDPGPMTSDSLAAGSSSWTFGSGEIDDISLFPVTAARGQEKVANWTWPSLLEGYWTDIGERVPDRPDRLPIGDPHFYNYQLETLLGQHVRRSATSTVPAYCRIATREDYYLISYFALFTYNGGLGPQTSFVARPLERRSGFGAHIGDWTRVTAKVKIANKRVSLLYVDYEAHGDQNFVTKWNFNSLPLEQVKQLTVYAAWHSHEAYPNAGIHPRTETWFTANDYTDDGGVKWNTKPNLAFISDRAPSWVRYNGLWGANITVPGTLTDYVKNGPEGPAFHYYWVSETKDRKKPVQQWKNRGAALRTNDGHFVTVVNGGGLNNPAVPIQTGQRQVGAWEKFTVEPIDRLQETFALRTASGHYLSAVNGGGMGGAGDANSPVHTDATWAGGWEHVTPEPQEDGTYAIATPAGHYLTATDGGGRGAGAKPFPIQTNATKVASWETFRLHYL